KKPCRLLQLPGELRNQIWGYVYDRNYIVKCDPEALQKKDPKGFAKKTPQLPRNTVMLVYPLKLTSKKRAVQTIKPNWKTSLMALLLTNRQIHDEVLSFVYGCATFVFKDVARIRSFIRYIPSAALPFVTKLDITYTTYGEPRNYDDRVFKNRSDTNWERTCKLIANSFVGVRKLSLHLTVLDTPTIFTIDQKWIVPLMCF
ncbi:hypothetical protein K402DRAFT_305697, partial [Aulographum hederae CBS 113979]